MTSEILIEAGPIETRVALVENGELAEFLVEETDDPSLVGSIWLGRVSHIAAGLQAAFVDLGLPRAGFLNRSEAQALAEPGDRRPIEKLLHEGQWILVQVRRDAQGDKGVGLTTSISLPGRFLVLTPHRRAVSISRRIEDQATRARLERALTDFAGGGAILRTAAADASDAALLSEAARLAERFREFTRRRDRADAPTCLWREPAPALRILRDRMSEAVAHVLIDDGETCRAAQAYAAAEMPGLADRIGHYREQGPLLARHGLLDAIELLESPDAPLPSGGAITIEATRALTAIDVDSGRDTAGGDRERTALRTNLEAAAEVARQMRLRDIGGIIVVDFIELREPAHREQLMARLRAEIRRDRAPVRLSGLSEFGLVEMTRRRSAEALGLRQREACAACAGRGTQPNVTAEIASALRALEREAAARPGPALILRLPPRAAEALARHPALERVRRRIGASLEIESRKDLAPGQYDIFRAG